MKLVCLSGLTEAACHGFCSFGPLGNFLFIFYLGGRIKSLLLLQWCETSLWLIWEWNIAGCSQERQLSPFMVAFLGNLRTCVCRPSHTQGPCARCVIWDLYTGNQPAPLRKHFQIPDEGHTLGPCQHCLLSGREGRLQILCLWHYFLFESQVPVVATLLFRLSRCHCFNMRRLHFIAPFSFWKDRLPSVFADTGISCPTADLN